jgi:mRNA interferase MazF
MVMIIPLTTRDRKLRHQPRLEPVGNGLEAVSFFRPENLKAITQQRPGRPVGRVRDEELAEVREVLREFLGL